MNIELKQKMAKALSNEDIMRAIDYKANLVTYSNIKNYKNLNQLLGKYGCCIILYHDHLQTGHWSMILKHGNEKEIEVFDSFGLMLDDSLKWETRFKIPKILTKLIYDSNHTVVYNDVKLQQKKQNVATCGRHIIIRNWLRNLHVDSFCDLMKSTPYSPDELVTILTWTI
jgi:hypothetical protein